MSKLKIASAITHACAVATAVLAAGAAVHLGIDLEAKAPKAVDTTTVYTTHKISYAFLETRPYTNRYGGICGADTYLHCGVIQDDGSIKEETEDVDYVTIKYSDEDNSLLKKRNETQLYRINSRTRLNQTLCTITTFTQLRKRNAVTCRNAVTTKRTTSCAHTRTNAGETSRL